MDWGMMDPVGTEFCLGDMVEGVFVPAYDCEDIMDAMLKAIANENDDAYEVRRRMATDKIVEQDIIPLLKVCGDKELFAKAIRLMVNLTQPYDQYVQPFMSVNVVIKNEVTSIISSVKHQCTDVDFLKAIATNMKEILSKESLSSSSCQCLNHCLLLLRNLFHIKPSAGGHNSQPSIDHQCLVSSFFINELDQVLLAMLNHKLKENWTIGLTQLISFLFKDYSGSLLEPDIDDSRSASSSERDPQELVEILTPGPRTERNGASGGTDQNLSSNFKNKLQLCSTCESVSRSSEDDDFLLEFKNTEDGKLEIKLTNCQQTIDPGGTGSGSGDDMDTGNKGTASPDSSSDSKNRSKNGSNSSLNSVNSGKDADAKAEEGSQNAGSSNGEDQTSQNSSSCLMDLDILIAYLKRFASDIMGSSFVQLVEDIMKALLTKYDNILDHSYLMWTVGFFLSFAHQQDLDFRVFKDILNLDLFGFLVYEGVTCCEALQIKRRLVLDSSVEKHRLHLVVCTLNQMFRALLNNSKMEHMQNFIKHLSQMSQLRDLFVLLTRYYQPEDQAVVYLRDIIQTNHVLMIMVEEWISQQFLTQERGFSMLNHVKQFATKDVMAKYGSLLSHQEVNRETVNVAVLTMMYHVAGDCSRQDTLMQLPILKSFYEIWMENALKGEEEFKDLIEFVLEFFMSNAEKDPNSCAQNLFFNVEPQREEVADERQEENERRTDGSGSRDNESPMNLGSSSSDDIGDEEQGLIFAWVTELEDSEKNLVDIVQRRLESNGYVRTKEQVKKCLIQNGFVEDDSPSSSTSEHSPTDSGQQSAEGSPVSHKSLASQLNSMPSDMIMTFLLDKLRSQGFEPHLQWLQSQLLETAYIKLAIKDPEYRYYVEEPVPKFFALQNKPVPIVPWNEELESALADPCFHALQQNLGLFTAQDGNLLFPRIPQYMSPSLLVSKARQIGPIDSVPVKFDIDSLKETPEDFGLEAAMSTEEHAGNSCQTNRHSKLQGHQWLGLINRTNNKCAKLCSN